MALVDYIGIIVYMWQYFWPHAVKQWFLSSMIVALSTSPHCPKNSIVALDERFFR
jgi:hypothetical protein